MSSCTLLLVAPEDWTLHLRQTLFAREGMRIVQAGNFTEARQKARFAPPDLAIVLADAGSAEVEAFCKWLRAEMEKKVTVVVMLPADDPARARALTAVGADEVIMQPASSEALTPLVARMLEAPMRQEIRVPAEIRILGETALGTLQGLTRNVSMGGALLELTGVEIRSGDTLFVRLHPHTADRPIIVRAEVKRVAMHEMSYQVGVAFTQFEKDGRDLLAAFLQTVTA